MIQIKNFKKRSRFNNIITVNNNYGGAYIITVIIMLVLFSLSASLLYMSGNATLAASVYNKNIGGYEAAVSGITYASDFLQKKANENHRLIDKKCLNDILSAPLHDIAYYKDSSAGKYLGEFYLKAPDSWLLPGTEDCLYHQLYDKYTQEFLSSVLTENCSLSIQTGEDLYSVTVEIAIDDGIYIIDSEAINEKTGVSAKVQAKGCFTFCEGELFIEKYLLDTDIPLYLSNGIYSGGELINDSSVFIADSAVFSQTVLPTVPTVLTGMEITGGVLDISIYDSAAGEYPALIIYNEGGNLNITASNPMKNYFEGIIISYGGITLADTSIQIKGQVYCAGNLNLKNSNLNIEYKNMLPYISFDSINRKREVLNNLGIINFNSASVLFSGIQIESILLSDENAGLFKIINLRMKA